MSLVEIAGCIAAYFLVGGMLAGIYVGSAEKPGDKMISVLMWLWPIMAPTMLGLVIGQALTSKHGDDE